MICDLLQIKIYESEMGEANQKSQIKNLKLQGLPGGAGKWISDDLLEGKKEERFDSSKICTIRRLADKVH